MTVTELWSLSRITNHLRTLNLQGEPDCVQFETWRGDIWQSLIAMSVEDLEKVSVEARTAERRHRPRRNARTDFEFAALDFDIGNIIRRKQGRKPRRVG